MCTHTFRVFFCFLLVCRQHPFIFNMLDLILNWDNLKIHKNVMNWNNLQYRKKCSLQSNNAFKFLSSHELTYLKQIFLGGFLETPEVFLCIIAIDWRLSNGNARVVPEKNKQQAFSRYKFKILQPWQQFLELW